MFTDFIEKLRKKPEENRVLIMWITVAIIMVIIIASWIVFGIKQNPAFQESNSGAKETANFFNQLGTLFRDAKEGAINLKDDLGKVLGDVLSGKNDPKELPSDIKEYLPENVALPTNPPLTLPETR